MNWVKRIYYIVHNSRLVCVHVCKRHALSKCSSEASGKSFKLTQKSGKFIISTEWVHRAKCNLYFVSCMQIIKRAFSITNWIRAVVLHFKFCVIHFVCTEMCPNLGLATAFSLPYLLRPKSLSALLQYSWAFSAITTTTRQRICKITWYCCVRCFEIVFRFCK